MNPRNRRAMASLALGLLLASAIQAAAAERRIVLNAVDAYTWQHARHQGQRQASPGTVIISSLWPGIDHQLQLVAASTNPWPTVRGEAVPALVSDALLMPPRLLDLHTDGWEDGLTVSRSGLHLYAIYAPADLLRFTFDAFPYQQVADYLRGPTLGMDLDASTVVGISPWPHGDIVRSSRASSDAPFSPWALSDLSFPVTSEGAPALWGETDTGWSLMVYTSNQSPPHYAARIYLVQDQDLQLSQAGSPLPEPVNPPLEESWQTDNPHLERLSDDSLILFFDSNRPGGPSEELSIWYSSSADNGISWSVPLPVTSVNTLSQDHQPHLWQDQEDVWWLWWSAVNPGDGKLAIYRAYQQIPGDWDSWSSRELVISAGTSAGIGEPTLTTAGDLYFIVISEDPNPGPAGRFAADPWWAPAVVIDENG